MSRTDPFTALIAAGGGGLVLAAVAHAPVSDTVMAALTLAYVAIILWLARRCFRAEEERTLVSVEKRTTELRAELAEYEWQRAELAELYSEVLEANARAEDAHEAKGRFLANMSHELRTPLTGVIGMTSILRNTELDPQQRECVEVASRCGENLLKIINEILDFSKIEAHKLTLEEIDFQLRNVIEETLESLSSQAREKQLSLSAFVDPKVDRWLCGDPVRLRQILMNLVGNAIKFTETGHVVLRCTAEARHENGSLVLSFAVEDSGIGIPDEIKEQLFEPFTQADDSTTRRFGGTGLGLAISRQIVELMGGCVGLESTEGRGSTFWFRAHFDAARAATTEDCPSLEAVRGARVLCIGEHAMDISILGEQLRAFELDVDTAVGAIEAFELLATAKHHEIPYQAVLIELNMQEMDGFTLARELRSGRFELNIPLVALTDLGGHVGENDKLGDAGFCRQLSRPLREDELRACLHEVLTGEFVASQTPVGRVLEPLETSTGEGPFVLLVEDDSVIQVVASQMLRKLGCRVRVAVDGEEGVRAYSEHDFDVVLMDCRMPVLSGYDATRRIREIEDETGAHVPIVALTANALRGDREKCLAAGMDDYVSKPVKLRHLREALRRWCGPERVNELRPDSAPLA